jgi:signal transduction histidine kinase
MRRMQPAPQIADERWYPGEKQFKGHNMIRRQYSFLTAAAIFGLLICVGCQVALATESKRVMLLHSFGREFRPWNVYANTIRNELGLQSPWPLDVIEHSLITARFGDDDSESAFVQYLRALYAKHPLDLIICLGAPAVGFVQRHRQELFPFTPMLFTSVEQRRIQPSSLTENDTVVAITQNFPAIIENILHVLPDTETVAVVIGNSPLERLWLEVLREEFAPFADRLSFIWYNDRSFADILKHSAALPPHSAILWHQMNVDAAGVVQEGDKALPTLYAVANAPIFSFTDAFFGGEVVGGPMNSAVEGSRLTVAVALRILGGEKAGDIKTTPIGFATPKFDWREMQRWGISEKNLPPGSEIYFREPSLWDQYRVQILAAIAAVAFQALLISWLLYERRFRHRVEIVARDAVSELTQLNRIAAAGELSASIAHELNQPLTGIVTRASAARRWLAAERPDIDKARAALDQIENAGHRAGDIIQNVRAMFKKDTHEKLPVDVNRIILEVLALGQNELQKHQIEVHTELDDRLPSVTGNRVQLQQVILNLVMNAVEAMHSAQPRRLRVQSRLSKPDVVHVSIEDTGAGIDPTNLTRIFKPLFTTKERGMGMGLSICHSIIESHDGRIWASRGVDRGSIFQFELPTNTKAGTMAA